MTKQIEVRFKGLNELGVKELNEFYKLNIEKNYIEPYKLGDKIINSKKRFKQPKSFYKSGLETYVGIEDMTQCREDEEKQCGYGPRFSFQLKHFNHEIYEIEITETVKQITL